MTNLCSINQLDGIVDGIIVVFDLAIKADPIVIQYPIKMIKPPAGQTLKNQNPVSSYECTLMSTEGTAALHSDNIPAL